LGQHLAAGKGGRKVASAVMHGGLGGGSIGTRSVSEDAPLQHVILTKAPNHDAILKTKELQPEYQDLAEIASFPQIFDGSRSEPTLDFAFVNDIIGMDHASRMLQTDLDRRGLVRSRSDLRFPIRIRLRPS
jgi:hypothetical protein